MSKTWKWILGIALVLVLLGGMFAIGFAWRTHTLSGASYRNVPFGRDWDGPSLRGTDNWGRMPMTGRRFDGFNHPMMGGYMPFFGGFFLLGGLLKFALFVGLLYGAYWLGKRNARFVPPPQPVAPAPAESTPEPAPKAE